MSNQLKNVVISACAGSGKTRALIERLLLLLKNGVAPGSILAITFTRKTAAEIEARLLSELQQRADGGEVWAEECLRRLLLAEQAKDELNIHTFHGWFRLLLVGKRWTRGWYGPADIVEKEKPLCLQAWQRWLQQTKAASVLAAVLRECSPHSLRQLLTEQLVHHQNAWWRRPPEPPSVLDEEAEKKRLQHALQQFVAASGKDGGQALQKARQAAADYLENNDDSRLKCVEEAFFTRSGTLRQALIKSAQNCSDELQAVSNAWGSYALAAATAGVLAFHRNVCILAEEYLSVLQEVKSQRNQMSFNDLEHESCQRLQEDGGDVNAMLRRIDSRFHHILIDEFQDTSPLQWQIIKCWLQEVAGDAAAPSVFIVGDEKQAIYRFRHGDARLLNEARKFLHDYYDAEYRQQDNCYRLSPVLLDLVNAVFEKQLPNYVRHTPGGKNENLPGRVEWRELKIDTPPPPARMRNPLCKARVDNDKRRQWARCVAEKIQTILDERWMITDGDEVRPARAEDILLLLPGFTHAPHLCQALQHCNLSYTMRNDDAAQLFVWRDIAALITVLLAPDNRLSLAQVLKSPLFALSEDALAALADGDMWQALLASNQPAAEKLRRWRRWALAGTLPVYDLLARIFTDGDVFARYRAAVLPACRQQVTAELSALLDFSLGSDGGRQPLLAQFLESLSASTLPDSGGGIRLMSVHSAKGLESPIVVLADCGFDKKHSGGGKESVKLLIDWPPQAATPETFIFCPAAAKHAFSELLENEENRAEREYDNLFYVALTRAKQGLLIFSLADDDNTRIDALRCAMQTLEEDGACRQTDGTWVFGEALAGGAAPLAPAQKPQTPLTVTTGAMIDDSTLLAGQRGSILHRQMALLLQGYGEEVVRRGADAALFSEAKQLLQNEQLRQLLDTCQRYEVEVEFVHKGDLLRVDLLIFKDEEIWLIDYKTGGGALARYQQRMQDYCDSVAAVYGGKTVQAAFVTPQGFFPCEAVG